LLDYVGFVTSESDVMKSVIRVFSWHFVSASHCGVLADLVATSLYLLFHFPDYLTSCN